MKILLLNYEYPPIGGGGGIAMMEFARELAQRHQVHVVTSGIDELDEITRDGEVDLTVHRPLVAGRSDRATASMVSMAAYLQVGRRTANDLCQRIKFDVMNTWFAIPTGIVGAAVSTKNKIPHVLTIIGGDIYDPSKWYSPHHFMPSKAVVKWVLNRADRHLAISSDIANRARRYFGFEKHIEVIPLGITQPKIKAVQRADIGMSPSRKYVIAVGRLVRRKDYPTLMRAVKTLGREDTDLIILGDGPEKENLQKLADTLGMKHRIHFKGFVSNESKYQYLSNSDLFALVSLHEGFGIVYLEAMYCGLPIVAANEGGQVDLLNDPSTGRLVSAGNVEQMTTALQELLADEALRTAIGASNRKRFDEFSIANLSVRYEKEFEKAVAMR